MSSLICFILLCITVQLSRSGEITVTEFAKNGEVLSFIYFGAGNEFDKALFNNGLAGQLDKVECVSLIGPDIVQSQLNRLSRLTSLQILHFGFYPDPVTIENAAVLELSRFTNIEELLIHGKSSADAPWESIGNLHSLESLRVTGDVVFHQKAMQAIGSLSKLRHLDLNTKLSATDYEWIAKLVSLESLILNCDSISQALLNSIDGLNKLESLELRGGDVNQQMLQMLSDDFAERILELELTVSSDVSAIDLVRFGSLRQLILHLTAGSKVDCSLIDRLPNLDGDRHANRTHFGAENGPTWETI